MRDLVVEQAGPRGAGQVSGVSSPPTTTSEPSPPSTLSTPRAADQDVAAVEAEAHLRSRRSSAQRPGSAARARRGRRVRVPPTRLSSPSPPDDAVGTRAALEPVVAGAAVQVVAAGAAVDDVVAGAAGDQVVAEAGVDACRLRRRRRCHVVAVTGPRGRRRRRRRSAVTGW